MTFAPMQDADIPSVIALWDSCGLLRPWNPPEQDIADLRAHPAADILVAHDGAQVIASVAVGADGHRGWVYYLATVPDRRGTGLGRSAMTAAETWLRVRGVPKLHLMVRNSNTAVISFYEALGYENGQCVLLQKWLDPERDRLYRAGQNG